jgi:hypothetical protein
VDLTSVLELHVSFVARADLKMQDSLERQGYVV